MTLNEGLLSAEMGMVTREIHISQLDECWYVGVMYTVKDKSDTTHSS